MARPDLTARDVMARAPVVPVLVVERVADAAPLADALATGGLTALEVTLRTPDALEVVREMARARPDALVGAGTVLDADTMERARDAGARFFVSPGLSERLVRAAERLAAPLLSGVATGSEILRGLEFGLDAFKFFPAAAMGGSAALAAFHGPFPRVAFCPTGGIGLATAPDYLRLGNVPCVGGSWVAPRDAVLAGDFARIRRLAEDASRLGAAATAA